MRRERIARQFHETVVGGAQDVNHDGQRGSLNLMGSARVGTGETVKRIEGQPMTAARDREFEEFVQAAWPRLRRAAYLLSHDTHEAEDLVQSALTRSYARWPAVRREGAYSYVHRAVVNAYIDSTRRRRPVPTDTSDDSSSGARAATDTANTANAGVEDRSELVELLAPLSPRERTIIVWRYYLDTPEKEVADRLGIAPGTVRSTASRALARLRADHSSLDHEGTQG